MLFRSKLKSAFINNISHEVRTPLNGILGFSELITQDGLSDTEKEQFRSLIKISSTRLLNTITNYMDIALLMSGNMVISNKLFQLHKQLHELYNLFLPLCKVKQIELMLKIPEDVIEITLASDHELHWKFLSHLIDNAVKFTHSGSITIGYHLTGNTIEYFVADTGIGIARDLQQKIFENFRQGEISNTREYEGSGLGLSIANGIVNLLGGKITVDSSRGEGAIFTVMMAYDEIKIEQNKVMIPVINQSRNVIKNRIILLVEDDLTNFLLEEKILKKSGFEVVAAYNGKEAVEKCLSNPDIELVLMDIKMPVMDGFEATRKIKAIRPDLPVIAVTAFAMSGDEKKALEAGCNDYIAKPIVEKYLLKVLAAYGFVTNS